MHGDGYTSTVVCENFENDFDFEPDAGPLYCNHLTWGEEQRYLAASPYAVLQVEDPFTGKHGLKVITRVEFDRQMALPDLMWHYRLLPAYYCDDMSEALQNGRYEHVTTLRNKLLTYESAKMTVNTVSNPDDGTWKTTLTVGDTIAIYPHYYWIEARLFFFALKNAEYVEDLIEFADLLHHRSQ
jgi:hypothetical protein